MARDKLTRVTSGVKQSAVREYMEGGLRQRYILGEDLNASVRANELMRFVTVGVVDDLDRYRAAHDDLDAAEASLNSLRDTRSKALASARKQRASAIAEVNRLARLQKTLDARLRARSAVTHAAAHRSS